MSILNKIWEFKNVEEGLSVVDKILQNRGLTNPEDIAAFIDPDFKSGFHDPFLLIGMDKAVKRIKSAIENNERIIVYGDYDVDGISGAAILVLTLEHLGAQVSYRLPHRSNDGYGLHKKYMDEFKEADVSLVITVDCGISNVNEINYANEKGIDVIVTDHHTIPKDFPEKAVAIIHPAHPESSYPFKELTGSGVAFKVAQALLSTDGHGKEDNQLVYALLDLASLGTVADCGPIIGENRLIVKKGLEMMPHTKWEGLKFLQEIAGIDPAKPFNTHTIGFQIAPRINAAGRIDSPYYALQLLIKKGETQSAKNLASKLEKLNKKRQNMLKEAMREAESRFLENPEGKIILDYDRNWHVGIIGLVAGK